MSLFMDGYSRKRAGDGLVVSRRGSAVLRDTANDGDRNAQFCNRIGCSGRLNSAKSSQISCSEKAKSSRLPFRSSSSGKEIIGSSSKTCSTISNPRKHLREHWKKLPSHVETDSSETGSAYDEPEELAPPPANIQIGSHHEPDDSGSITSTEVGSSSVATSTKPHRTFHQKTGLGNTTTVFGPSVPLTSKSTSQGMRMNPSRYGLKNVRCSSASDVVSSGSSSLSDSRKKDLVKKRICDGESSSSARGKRTSGSSSQRQNSSSGSGISISDSRRARNGPDNRDNGALSVRTRRSLSGYNRTRAANQGSGNSLSPNESHVVISQMSQPEIPINLNAPSSSHQFPWETSLSHPSSYSRPSSSSETYRGLRLSSLVEIDNTGPLMNRESFRHYNMDGIAEVLFALERIEQDEELTYEQLLILETNLLLNGLNLYDQHRDMRLDIDNMSYEELLALEERMGTVSTALTEGALSECLKTSIYLSAPTEDEPTDLDGDKYDVKCSICQEEYVVGDEVGRLQCEHRYHVACIYQWLRLKNWCPICKTSAAPPSSSPSS